MTIARLTHDTAEDIVVNRAGGRMLTPTATELRVRELERWERIKCPC